MGLMVFGLVTVVFVAALVVYWAFVWEKDSGGGLDPQTQARVEAVQERSATAARIVREQVDAAGKRAGTTLSRTKALESKTSTGTS